jgi:DNA-binding FrmR family transcriptional regulator
VSENVTFHTLENTEQADAIVKRLKRASGQLTAVVRMMEEGRSCEDVVTQIAAVSKAINAAAFTLISSSLKECLVNNEMDADVVAEKLQKLFLSLA